METNTAPIYRVEISDFGNYNHGTVSVNGETFERFVNDDGCRGLYVNNDRTLLVKLESRKGLRQFAIEAQIWQEISDEDRKHFSPILAAGESDRHGYILTEFYNDLEDSYRASQEQRDLANGLAKKYSISDWCDRQWKTRGDGSIIIHDFGISPTRDNEVEVAA